MICAPGLLPSTTRNCIFTFMASHMLYRVKNSTWNRCSATLKEKLERLTLSTDESKNGSLMRVCIREAKFGPFDPEIFTLQTPLTYNAWSMLYYNYWFSNEIGAHDPIVMIYVRPTHRRRGFGSLLLNRVREKYPLVKCRPWDFKSKMFYVHHNVITYRDQHPSEMTY